MSTINKQAAKNSNKNSKLLGQNAGVTCYSLVRTRNSQQEWYETASRQAAVRARFLRNLGYTVTVSPMGIQITSVGRVRMTLLTIDLSERDSGLPVMEPPAPGRVVWL